MIADRVAEVRPSSQEVGIVDSTSPIIPAWREVVGCGIKPLRTFNVLPAIQLATFYFNEETGMAEIIGRQVKFDPDTGILEITDRSEQVYAKLQDLFDSIRLVIPEVNESNLQPPPMRVTRINELVAA